jgi:nitrite reductase/ring-hydroxylating ferredoxin subunit
MLIRSNSESDRHRNGSKHIRPQPPTSDRRLSLTEAHRGAPRGTCCMSDNIPALPRRIFLATSCATACLAAAGCSVGEAPSGEDTASDGPITLSVNDVPVGGGIVLADRQVVVTQPEPGTFRAFSAICSHQGCTVNRVRNGTIECPCHNSAFSITDGVVVRSPATEPLPNRAVTRTVDTLTVD